MARRLAAAIAFTLLALMLMVPAVSAEDYPPDVDDEDIEAIEEEADEVDEEDVEPATEEDTRPADVDETEVLAATGFDTGVGLLVGILLLASGASVLLVARRRQGDTPA